MKAFGMIVSFLCMGLYASAKPVVFWASDPVGPGDTVIVFGAGFNGCEKVQVSIESDNLDSNTSARITSLKPVQVDERCVKFQIPRSFPAGVYDATIRTPNGEANVIVNRPQILWTQGDQGSYSSPGGEIRIMGKCFTMGNDKPLIRIIGNGGSYTIHPSVFEPFSISAKLPSSIRPGKYILKVHSGVGNLKGWSAPADITIVKPYVFPSKKYVVPPVAGFVSALDTTMEIQRNLDKAGNAGGGVVYLPRGRYAITGRLVIPRNVTLQGAGEALTALCWADTENPPEELIRGYDHFQIKYLTLYSMSWKHGIVSDLRKSTCGHINIIDVRLRMDPYRGHITQEEVAKRFKDAMTYSTGGADSLRLGGEDIQISGCDIYGGGRSLYLQQASGAWVHDNTFYNGRWGWYCLTGSDGLLMEHNNIIGASLMSTGGSPNCYDTSYSQDIYFSGNMFKNMFGWDREAITTDAGGGAYYGYVDSSNGRVVHLKNDPNWNDRNWVGAGLFILGGKGEGQYRRITSYNGPNVTVDSPWLVPPDNTSIITITMLHRNYLFVDNRFEDAGIAIQMYGTSIGNIAYGNISARTGGFHNFGMNYGGIQPSWYNQWLDNKIVEGNTYAGGHDQSVTMGEAHLGIMALPPGVKPVAPLTLCCVMRGNVLYNNAHLTIGGTDTPGQSVTFPYTQEVVAEKNTVKNADEGLFLSKSTLGVYLHDNHFIDCSQNITSEGAEAYLLRKAYERFAAKPGPLLHITFDNMTDNVFPDETGNGFNAVCKGDCKPSNQGPDGHSVKLDGQSYLIVSRSPILMPKSFTISVWFKSGDLQGRWGLLSKRYGSMQTPFVLGVTDGHPTFEATDGDGNWAFNFQCDKTLQPNAWHQLVAVVKDGEGVVLYADGTEAGRKDVKESVSNTTESLYIGREAWGGNPPKGDTPALFTGWVGDVEMWHDALGPSDISRLWHEAKIK